MVDLPPGPNGSLVEKVVATNAPIFAYILIFERRLEILTARLQPSVCASTRMFNVWV